jgi:hypothetical protein
MSLTTKKLKRSCGGDFIKLTKINPKFIYVIALGTRGLIVSVAYKVVLVISMAMPVKQIPMGWTYILFSHVSFSASCLDIFE